MIFSEKNYSPQQVSFFTALPLSLVNGIMAYFISGSILLSAAAILLIFLLAYFSILFMVRRFIYRKIKIIYKLIYQTKASKREEFYYKNILPQKSIEVREDVEQWAEQRGLSSNCCARTKHSAKNFYRTFRMNSKRPSLPSRAM